MLPGHLESVEEAALQSLVTQSVRERRTLEFKAALKLGKDSDRKEFLADVSSIANASGGDIIFGINDEDGVAVGVNGLDQFSPDQDQLKVEEIIRNGIKPRIIGHRAKQRPLCLDR